MNLKAISGSENNLIFFSCCQKRIQWPRFRRTHPRLLETLFSNLSYSLKSCHTGNSIFSYKYTLIIRYRNINILRFSLPLRLAPLLKDTSAKPQQLYASQEIVWPQIQFLKFLLLVITKNLFLPWKKFELVIHDTILNSFTPNFAQIFCFFQCQKPMLQIL